MKPLSTLLFCLIAVCAFGQSKQYSQAEMNQAVNDAFKNGMKQAQSDCSVKPFNSKKQVLVPGDRFIISTLMDTRDYIVKYVVPAGCYCFQAKTASGDRSLDLIPNPEKSKSFLYLGKWKGTL